MATRLTKLRLTEISGVDDPAHEIPGWIVAKSADWRADVEQFEKDIVGLYEGLTGGSADLYLNDAPDEVNKARDVLAVHLAKGLEDVEDEEEEDEEPARKRVVAKMREIFGVEKDASEDTEDDEEEADGEEVAKESGSESEEELEEDEEVDDEGETVAKESETEDEDEDEEEEARNEDDLSGISKSELQADLNQAVEQAMSPIREAVLSIADRVEGLEKHAASRRSLEGQEVKFEDDTEPDELTKAIGSALRGNKVTIR